MSKPIKSDDPRKPRIVQAFKEIFGASKVTQVKEGPWDYEAALFMSIGGRNYIQMKPVTEFNDYPRPFTITKEEFNKYGK